LTTENGGKGAPPCGEGDASNVITKVQGGHALPVKLYEYVIHPGHYRIALATRANLPPDTEVVESNGRSVSAAIATNPKAPVLADGAFVHGKLSEKQSWQMDVTIPNVACEKCTLQVIEFMAEHGLNKGGGFYYHHCADLQISLDPKMPAASPAWIPLMK